MDFGADFAELETKTAANEGVEIEIMKPDGESSGLFIRVLGQDSDAFNKLKERHDRARIRALSKGGRAAVEGMFDVNKNNEMELVCACCLGWRHVNGKPMPFAIGGDEEDTLEFFIKFPIAYDQVRVGIYDRMNFTKARP